jgi:hypothetical protein
MNVELFIEEKTKGKNKCVNNIVLSNVWKLIKLFIIFAISIIILTFNINEIK